VWNPANHFSAIGATLAGGKMLGKCSENARLKLANLSNEKPPARGGICWIL
jgi:hypothetical protein